jgi:hypothetical protein
MTTYEVLTLLVSAATPISVGVLGFFVNSRVKGLEHEQWQNRKIVEKRIEFFEKVAPDLNALLCFYTWVGDWKDHSPPQVIGIKRRRQEFPRQPLPDRRGGVRPLQRFRGAAFHDV